ncbi:Cellulose synthase like E1 [Hibiscus syriacus]|uniref:Cellulose synthase like E1 n=1 Tax=Hibiscus syriacus TaxID=106335 RepID=A0A6A3BZP5_HIBSY|nr:Cellulose synthase like E1 [Hibiscus syriacus]
MDKDYLPLFETRQARGRQHEFQLLSASIFIVICFILVYRETYFPADEAKAERLTWLGLFLAELRFSFYWFHTLIHRWNPVFCFTFKDRLSSRYDQEALPGVDIFVCTADPRIEPPIMKLEFKPRSPEAYFRNTAEPVGDSAMPKLGYPSRIPVDIRKEHKGFPEWGIVSSKHDHQTILQIRVSSRISNAPVILNVDCDMYSNNPDAIKDAMCFFMDEKKGHEIAYVQYPQNFYNLSKNDLYSSFLRVIVELELLGFDANGGPSYIGNGCFHRRSSLCGKTYNKEVKGEWRKAKKKIEESASFLEDTGKFLASCTYEQNTDWGNEVLMPVTLSWRSIYFNPERKAFLGIIPKTLLQYLIQHKRWAEAWENLYVVEAQSEVVDEKISWRYEQEVIEFGTPSVMFTILATLA